MFKSIKEHWQALLLLVLLCWMLGASAYHGAVNPNSNITGIDFQAYYAATQRLANGGSLYPPDGNYMYAPLVAWALLPFADVPLATCVQWWSVLNIAAVFIAVALYARAARLGWEHAVGLSIALLVTFRFWPTVCNLGMGQVNCLLLALVAGIILADFRDRVYLVGVLIAFAALIKLWMIGLIIHLAVRRAWGAVAGCLAAFAAMLAGNFFLVGWSEWPAFCQKIASPAASVQDTLVSQSLLGFARLRFASNSLVTPFTTDPLAYKLFLAAGVLAIGLALAWLCWSGPARSSQEARLRTGFVMLSLLLILPLCHMEYFILALPLLWTLLAPAPGDRTHFATILAGFAIYVAFTRPVPVSGPSLAFFREGARSLLVSIPFFTAVALWVVALAEIYRLRRMTASAPQPNNPQTAPTSDRAVTA
jgi:hypothetical protein